MYKYQQLSEHIRHQIEIGEYQKGDRLPSIRELTAQYHCNKDTVIKALQHLKDDHLLYPVAKSGYYVMKDIKKNESVGITGLPNPNQFSIEDFRRCLNESLLALQDVEDNEQDSFRGNQALLAAAHPLLESYGVYAPISRMVITTGTQQALYLLLQLIGEGGILIEQPTYPRMNQLVDALGIPYEVIERTVGGDTIDLKVLETYFASGKIKYFYTISRFHHPLGISYSDSVKKQMIAMAARYDIYIIEDDYMADYEAGTATPLHYFDMDERVIYVKSFSSILFAAFKIGIVVLPDRLVERFCALKQLLDYDSNHLMQKTLALYIGNGMFDKHRQKMLAQYQAKSKLLFPLADRYSVHGMQLLVTQQEGSQMLSTLPEGGRIDLLENTYVQGKSPYCIIDLSAVKKEDVITWVSNMRGKS